MATIVIVGDGAGAGVALVPHATSNSAARIRLPARNVRRAFIRLPPFVPPQHPSHSYCVSGFSPVTQFLRKNPGGAKLSPAGTLTIERMAETSSGSRMAEMVEQALERDRGFGGMRMQLIQMDFAEALSLEH